MARARNIKPGFYKNEDLAECSIWARYIFPGLWMLADREGRLEDRPKRIKGELLPFDGTEVEPLLQELARQGFISRYERRGIKTIQILKFKENQTPHHLEKPSLLPSVNEDSPVNDASTVPSVDLDSQHKEQQKKPRVNQESTEKHPSSEGGSKPPDSLIPDSLIPDSKENPLLSGKPDPDQSNGKKKLSEACAEVLQFLNEKTGRNYRPVKANIGLIAARLKEGATVVECRQVIAKKCREWRDDPKQEIYLRPKTLFNATNFANYQGELVA